MKKQFSTFLIATIFLTFGVFTPISQVRAETEISGNITSDTTWALANSPYHITQTVSVYPGAILTIEPGVIVKTNAEKYLQIAGTLVARGSEGNRITFTSYETGGSWGGIKFIDSAVSAQIDQNYNYINGSIIEYADVNSGLAWDCIRVEGASPFISHSDIHNCKNGIFIYNSKDSDFSNAVIYSNTIRDIPIGYGIQQTNVSPNKVSNGLVKIINNKINNTGTGIVSQNGQGPQIKGNTVTNGVSLDSSHDFLVENNTISGTVDIRSSSGDVKYNNINWTLRIYDSNLSVQFNTITAGTGADATIRVNCLGIINCSVIDSNNIYNTAVGGYAIWNWGNVDVNASNNYWGTINSSEIDNKIFDFYDDPSVGKVIYSPHASSVLKLAGSDIVSQPPTCTSWTYSNWSSCSNNGEQTRSTISSSPNSCAGGSPVLTQSCTYTPPACTSWTYSNWSTCQSNNTQNRTAISSSPSSCSGGSPVLTQSCTYTPPTCTSWNYSNWNVCANNQQTRTITSSQPASCVGGNPTVNQSCDSTPLCTESNWTSTLTPTNCPSNGQQIKKWTKIGQCQNGTSHSSEESVSCNYQAPTCSTFSYGDWSICNASGVQSRSMLSSSPSACVGGNPVLSQSCNYTSDAIPNIETKDNPPVSPNNQNLQNDSTLTKNNEQEVNQEKTITSSRVAEQRKSDVASAVQKIIQITEKDSGVAEQIKTIAQTQIQSQEKLETSLQKVQNRNRFTKFFVGPNYSEINNTKKLLEQNHEQIKQLDEIQSKLTNKNDKQKLTEQVKLLEQTNQEIENSLNTSQKGFSLFGWIFRLFTR